MLSRENQVIPLGRGRCTNKCSAIVVAECCIQVQMYKNWLDRGTVWRFMSTPGAAVCTFLCWLVRLVMLTGNIGRQVLKCWALSIRPTLDWGKLQQNKASFVFGDLGTAQALRRYHPDVTVRARSTRYRGWKTQSKGINLTGQFNFKALFGLNQKSHTTPHTVRADWRKILMANARFKCRMCGVTI